MKKLKIFKAIKAHYAVIGVIVLAMTFNGCEQLELEENPAGSQLAVVKYTTTEQLELGVRGIYGKLNKAAWMTTFYVNGWSGDDMTTHRASNKADFREYDQRAITPDNSRTFTNWRGVYEMIRAANTVLFSVEGQQLPDAAAQDALIGETHFLRGLMFYHLARVHSRIPLILELDANLEPTLASAEEVYAQIESDMLMAESLLPVTSNNGATKPNKGSARAILARLYLDWAGFPVNDTGKYAQAASSAKSVMDGGHGFALVPDMSTLYTIEGRFNTESLFTIAYCAPCGLPNRKHGKLGLPGSAPTNGWQETFAEIRYYEDFPEGPRKDATYHDAMPLAEGGGIITNASTPVVDSLPWQEFADQQNPIFRKIVGPFEEGTWLGFQSDRNDYYMRYSELLLIYAEASGRAGSAGADAWEALNMVRRRAAGLDINTPDPAVDVSDADGTIEELAFTERKWELAGEYIRWNDLVRMQRVEQALSNRNPQTSIGTMYDGNGNGTPFPLTEPSNPILGSLGTDNYFAPIPQQEIDQHPGLGN
ncbi:RagB/SusD family nutrient uptake outer membrane protein [Maribacter algarum]|uniref:RagB/SusD family nutrient uptake outer membrane protein n=1 Tax=Maribacter algarum (ex Zhang et al. 2020) TaxID=2578118 RepID=A0A5S3PGZ3_9FLAO|nr:RagB/SusD family nutrient uptake outer membrane protein [Maribacter algarum]TMM53403.1 RagB/SusD family nutrient uptake outer membrane protein [Maribacter algarum]